MSAAVITPAETVREAHAVLHVAMEAPGRAVLAAEIITLADWLDTYADLDEGALSGDWAFPHLRDEADPDEAALLKAAEEAGAAAGALIKAMADRGITSGAEAGTENEMTIPGVGK